MGNQHLGDGVDSFEAHGFVILTGVDARDGRGVALELTPKAAAELGVYLTATYGASL